MSKQVVTKLVVNTRKRNKATTFFRPILIIPILIFVSTFSSNNSGTVSISFLLAVPVLLALVLEIFILAIFMASISHSWNYKIESHFMHFI